MFADVARALANVHSFEFTTPELYVSTRDDNGLFRLHGGSAIL